MRTLMKVLKNLFGNNTKINANNIAVKKADNSADTLDNCVIVDSGSNENGSWVKWANGTMICSKKIKFVATCNNSWGSMYESEEINFGDMPQVFIDIPDILSGNLGRTGILEGIQGTTNFKFGTSWILRPTKDTASNNYEIDLFAFGKWK